MTKAFDQADPLQTVVMGEGAAAEQAARLAFWQAVTSGERTGDPVLDLALAADVMALYGQYSAEALRPWQASMLSRAASRLRAQAAHSGAHDLEITAQSTPFRGFFAVDGYDYHHTRFDGSRSGLIRREVFVAVDAVTVLPYDPRLDRVLVVEQIRSGPIARGDAGVRQLEAVAGRIDAGETPQVAAMRETREEAGLELSKLIEIAQYYPSPGAMSEYLYSYVALCDLPGEEGATALFGLPQEGEDIRTHLWSFDRAMAAISSGEIRNGPLLVSLLWLAREREGLRKIHS